MLSYKVCHETGGFGLKTYCPVVDAADSRDNASASFVVGRAARQFRRLPGSHNDERSTQHVRVSD